MKHPTLDTDKDVRFDVHQHPDGGYVIDWEIYSHREQRITESADCRCPSLGALKAQVGTIMTEAAKKYPHEAVELQS